MMIEIPPETPTINGSDDAEDKPTKLPEHPYFQGISSMPDTDWKLSGFGYVYKKPIVPGASLPKIMVN